MDAESVLSSLKFVQQAAGFSLNTEEKAMLTSSLLILKKNYNLDVVQLLGKIKGTDNDYLIAQGFGKVVDYNIKAFCSQDGASWVQLPAVTEKLLEDCPKIQSRFTGNLSTQCSLTPPVEGEDKEEDKEEGEMVTEEQRLATTIAMINHDAIAVPRGFYCLTTTGEVIRNRTFAGLSPSVVGQLSSYLHFRKPESVAKRTLLQDEKLDQSLDFLDPITDDLPTAGSWGIQVDGATGMATLRSLRWPGAVAYAIPGTTNCGYAYFGTGQINEDLAFQL